MRLLSVRETAEVCRVTEITIYRWLKAGRLPATRPGKSYLIPEAAVIEHLTKAQTGHTPIDSYVQAIVDSAPELTPEQISKLRQILGR